MKSVGKTLLPYFAWERISLPLFTFGKLALELKSVIAERQGESFAISSWWFCSLSLLAFCGKTFDHCWMDFVDDLATVKII